MHPAWPLVACPCPFSGVARALMLGAVDAPSAGPSRLVLVLAVSVLVVLALLARAVVQKKNTEQAAAQILSMSESMLNLSSLPVSRKEIGEYTLQEKLSEGVGFFVYRAVTRNGEACDVKIPTASALEQKTTMARLEREAAALEGIDSPNVVRFKAFERVKDRGRIVPLLVTEPVEGEELASVIKRVGPLHPLDVISIMLDLAGALAAVHRNEVIHRNLKPQSVAITESGRAILHNFGVVQTDDAQQLTQRGDVLGTGLYMSPEQITGKPLDPRSDLYSLGVLAYEMLAGTPPHAGVSFGELVMRKMTQDAPQPGLVVPGIPPELDDVVRRLLEKEPERRPVSAGYLITELSTLQASLEHPSDPSDLLEPDTF